MVHLQEQNKDNKYKRKDVITIKSVIKKHLPIIILAFILFIITSMSIQWVVASSGFKKNDDRWTNVEESLDKKEDIYPYNVADEKDVQITSVSLDVAYGVTRGLVSFHGEVPVQETCKNGDQESRADNYNDIPMADYPRTTLRPSRTTSGGDKADTAPNAYWSSTGETLGDIPTKDYWGIALGEADTPLASTKWEEGSFTVIPRATLEQVNHSGSGIMSLRLYALEQTYTHAWYNYITQFFYFLIRLLAQAALMILGLIVSIKNIDASKLLEVFGFDKVFEAMNNSFIRNGETGGLSPLTVFAIVAFIIVIVAYAIRWVKGKQKTRGLWTDILVFAAIGVIIIGMCLTGRINNMASIASNAMTKVLYALTDSMGDGDDAFHVEISDPTRQNRIVQMLEMSKVNKAFMDIQIEMQFNVSHMKDLDFDTLGITDANFSELSASNLTGLLVDSTNKKYVDKNSNTTGQGHIHANQFDRNLGYYFWAANSGAVAFTDYNKTYPETSAYAPYPKLDSMITTLQVAYNNGTAEQKENIRRLIVGLANPDVLKGQFKMILFTVILVLLALCLWKYALAVLGNQILMLLSLAGLTVAGPLMLTSNKKLVSYGKAILGLMVISLIKVSIFAAVFDLILYVLSLIISSDLINMIITMILLILLRKYASVLKEKLDVLFERIEGSMRFTQPLRAARRSIKNWGRSKRKNFAKNSKNLNALRNAKNPILSKLGNVASDVIGGEKQYDTTGNIKSLINAKVKKSADAAQERKETLDHEKERLKFIEGDINKEAEQNQNNFKICIEEKQNEFFVRVEDEHGQPQLKLDVDNLNSGNLDDDERKLLSRERKADTSINALMNSDTFKALSDKEALGELTEEEQAVLDQYHDRLTQLKDEKASSHNDLAEHIKERLHRETCQAFGISPDTDNDKEHISEAFRLQAQEAHKEELLEQLDRVEAAAKAQSDTRVKDGHLHMIHKNADRDAKDISDQLHKGHDSNSHAGKYKNKNGEWVNYDFGKRSDALYDMAYARQMREEVEGGQIMSDSGKIEQNLGQNYRIVADAINSANNGTEMHFNDGDQLTLFNAEGVDRARTALNQAAADLTSGKITKAQYKQFEQDLKDQLTEADRQQKELHDALDDNKQELRKEQVTEAIDAQMSQHNSTLGKGIAAANEMRRQVIKGGANATSVGDQFNRFVDSQDITAGAPPRPETVNQQRNHNHGNNRQSGQQQQQRQQYQPNSEEHREKSNGKKTRFNKQPEDVTKLNNHMGNSSDQSNRSQDIDSAFENVANRKDTILNGKSVNPKDV